MTGCGDNTDGPFVSPAGVETSLTLPPPNMTQKIANMNVVCLLPPNTQIIGYYLQTATHDGL